MDENLTTPNTTSPSPGARPQYPRHARPWSRLLVTTLTVLALGLATVETTGAWRNAPDMPATSLELTQVGTGPVPTDTHGGVRRVAFNSGIGVVPAWAQGWDRDHWWMTMSYADTANGGIATAAAACLTKLPWYACAPLTATLYAWVSGYGRASNHGIWVEVYRSGKIRGGRW